MEIVSDNGAEQAVPGGNVPKGRQAVYADADVDSLAWVETPSTTLDREPYRLLAYDRHRKTTRVISSSASLDTPTPPSGTTPILFGARVVWPVARFTGDSARPARLFLLSANLPNGPLRTEAADAATPSGGAGQLWYQKSSLYDPSVASGEVILRRRDLASGRDVAARRFVLAPGQSMGSMAAVGHAVAWAVNEETPDPGSGISATPSSIYLQEGEKLLAVIRSRAGEEIGDLVLTDRFLAWTVSSSSGGTFVLDRATSTIAELDSSPGLDHVLGSGSWLVWRAGDTWERAQFPRL